jgi:hypothetical protein
MTNDTYQPPVYSIEEVDTSLAGIEGKPVIGTLDHHQTVQYVEVVNAEAAFMSIIDATRRHRLEHSIEIAMKHEGNPAAMMHELVASGRGFFENEAEAIACLQRQAHWEQLNTAFWLDVRTQFNVWNARLSVRKGFRIVNLGKKFQF